ncbi:hypothetical protein HOP50_08g50620 [Chloropicon primus]|uniref:LamG-like jellyroll fold domain-containing protein n=1 Tax=Chloropicon primus TaxID=1764295 RepID=A0A5B8MPT2_9CHLO|nr:hypothetical protein A3770_08p50370 [Chloropicon primus]UPR01740.1 hypothetical protein HOP50_08g50620 [Chloropicon primus]|eukprot:QDZ22519.1 hypothetical protein A3770_08p50370 [Chloropicon primus]
MTLFRVRALAAASLLLVALLTTAVAGETVVKLNGINSVVEADETTELSSGVFSTTAWVWPEREGDANEEALVSFADGTKENSATIGWNAGRFYFRDDTKGKVETSTTYDRKKWHYVGITTSVEDRGVYLDAAGTKPSHRKVTLYVDGAKELEVTTVLPDLSSAVVTAGFEYRQHKKQKFFSGQLDEVRVYASELSAEQTRDLPFAKPPTGTKLYLNMDDIASLDLTSSTTTSNGVTYGHLEVVTVDYMPYDALTVASVAKVSPFSNSLYTDYQGPASGLTLTVTGTNFAETDFLKVTLDGVSVGYTYSSSAKLLVPLPSMLEDDLIFSQDELKKKVKVTNGGQNFKEFDFTLAYNIVEDLNANLEAHYNFDGHVKNVDKRRSENDATNANTYQGSATFTDDRNGKPTRALQFKYGQKLEVPVAVMGSTTGGSSTVCLWLYAEPGNHTLYTERGGASTEVYNELTVGSDGIIRFKGETGVDAESAGSPIIFDSWQFVCATRSSSSVALYLAGQKVATSAASQSTGQSLTALLASHLQGKLDDVWLWERALSSKEVNKLYDNQQYAVHLDGSHHFTLTDDAGESQFDSTSWHTNSEVTVEVWVKPDSTTGTSRVFYQPSKKTGATGDDALGFSVSVVDGRVEFRVMLDSDSTPGIFRSIATSDAVVETGKWQLVSVTYDQSSMMIAINGVAQRVGVSSLLSGSLTVNEPYSTKHTFLTIVTDPTSLDKQPIEASTKSIIVGESFKGYVGEVRMWNDDLTEAQVLSFYQCKPSVKSHANLYAYFPFDEGTGVKYSSGSAPLLVLAFSGTAEPLWVSSDHGKPASTIYWPHSPVSGSGTVSAKAGEVATFTFQAKDTCGNLLRKGGDPVQVVLAGPLDTHLNLFHGNTVDNGDGTYSGSYQADLCGFYALRVEDSSVPVTDGSVYTTHAAKLAKNTPIKVYVDSGVANASLSFVYDDNDLTPDTDDRSAAVAGANTKFFLQAIDEFGCIKKKGGDLFKVLLSGKYTQEGHVVDLGDGTYSLEYSPLVTGRSLLSVTLDDEHVGTNVMQGLQGKSVGWWTENNAGKDSKFGSYDGTSSPFCIDASFGSSLEFDGSSHVEVADSPAIDLSDKYTVDFFVKPTQSMLSAKLISKESPVSGRGYWVSLSGGLLSTGVYVGAEQYRYIETSYAPIVGAWTHLAVSYDGKKLVLYADGEVVGEQAYEEDRHARGNSQKLIIGNGLVGLMDELRFFGQALTKAEIASTMHCPSLSNSISAYYRMNDKVGDVVADLSSSMAHGTLKGAAWSTDEAPTNAGVLDLSASSFQGGGLSSAVVGENATITVTLVDKCGFPFNSVLTDDVVPPSLMDVAFAKISQGDKVAPVNNAKDLPHVSVSAQSDSCVGTNAFELQYKATSCGLLNLDMKIDNQPWGPYAVSFVSNHVTDPSKTEVSISSHVVSGVPFEIKLTTVDVHGCDRTTGGDTVHIALTRVSKPSKEGTLHGSDIVVSRLTVKDNGDGSYSAKATTPSPGAYHVDIGVNSVKVPSSPRLVTCDSPSLRKVLTQGPGELYNSMVASYKKDIYVVNGWGASKDFVESVWRYEPDLEENTWRYRSKLSFSSVPSHALSFTVDTKSLIGQGKMNADCSDLIFKSSSTSSNVPFWVDPLQGCDSDKTTIWLRPTEKECYMYYGNTHAKSSALSSAGSLMVVHDDFEGKGKTFADHGYTLTSPCGACFIPSDQDPAAFTVSTEVALSGKYSLKVNSLATAGGGIEKPLSSMATYLVKGYFYVSEAGSTTSAVNWFSPNYDPCTKVESTNMCSQGFIVGVNSQVSKTNYSSCYPWRATSVPQSPGWHSFEILDNGTVASFAIDGVHEPSLSRPSRPLDRVLLYTGGGSVGAWDSVIVAKYTPGIELTRGAEEDVIFNGKSFYEVSTRGTNPPSRRTRSYVMDGEKMYLIGGFGRYGASGSQGSYGAIGPHAAEDKVWSLNFNKMRWSSEVPYGSLRPTPREHHSMALHGKKIYVFGGKSGGELLSDLFVYDIDENAYATVKSTGPSPRYGHAAATFEDGMYVFGGYTDSGLSTEMWRFDYNSLEWANITPKSPPEFGPWNVSPCVYNASWYVKESTGKLFRYDFLYNQWVDLTISESSAGSGGENEEVHAGCAFAGGDLYLYGGRRSSSYSSDFFQVSL